MPYKKHLSQLKDFSLADINSCLFYFLLENTTLKGEKEEKIKKLKEEFRKNLKKEKSEKFLEKYRIFNEFQNTVIN